MSTRGEKLLVSLFLQAFLAAAFSWLQARPTPSPTNLPPWWLVTPLYSGLPLVPAAVWLYISWYPAPLLLLRCERDDFRRAAASVLVAFALCAVGFLLLPVTMNRPALTADAGLSSTVLATVYAIDPPHNAFPSFHAALCAVVLGFPPQARLWRAALTLWMLGISVSCVLTKQHYVLDVVAGLFVGYAAVQTVEYAARVLRGDAPARAAARSPVGERAAR